MYKYAAVPVATVVWPRLTQDESLGSTSLRLWNWEGESGLVSVLVDGSIVCTLGRCPGGIFCPGGIPGDIFCLQRKLGEGERRKR